MKLTFLILQFLSRLMLTLLLASCVASTNRDPIHTHEAERKYSEQSDSGLGIDPSSKNEYEKTKKENLASLSENLTKEKVISGCQMDLTGCSYLQDLRELPQKVIQICQWIQSSSNISEKWLLWRIGQEIKGAVLADCLDKALLENYVEFDKIATDKRQLKNAFYVKNSKSVEFDKLMPTKILEDIKTVDLHYNLLEKNIGFSPEKAKSDLVLLSQLENLVNGTGTVSRIDEWIVSHSKDDIEKIILAYLKLKFLVALRSSDSIINDFIHTNENSTYTLNGSASRFYDLVAELVVKNKSIWSTYISLTNRIPNLINAQSKSSTIYEWKLKLDGLIAIHSEIPHAFIVFYKINQWQVILDRRFFIWTKEQVVTLKNARFYKYIFQGKSSSLFNYLDVLSRENSKSVVFDSIGKMFQNKRLQFFSISDEQFVNQVAYDVLGSQYNEQRDHFLRVKDLTDNDNLYNLHQSTLSELQVKNQLPKNIKLTSFIMDPFWGDFQEIAKGKFPLGCINTCLETDGTSDDGFDVFGLNVNRLLKSKLGFYLSEKADVETLVSLYKEATGQKNDFDLDITSKYKSLDYDMAVFLNKKIVQYSNLINGLTKYQKEFFERFLDFQKKQLIEIHQIISESIKGNTNKQEQYNQYLKKLYFHPVLKKNLRNANYIENSKYSVYAGELTAQMINFAEKYYQQQFNFLPSEDISKNKEFENHYNSRITCTFKADVNEFLKECFKVMNDLSQSSVLGSVYPWMNRIQDPNRTSSMADTMSYIMMLNNSVYIKKNLLKIQDLVQIYIDSINILNIPPSLARLMQDLGLESLNGSVNNLDSATFSHLYVKNRHDGMFDQILNSFIATEDDKALYSSDFHPYYSVALGPRDFVNTSKLYPYYNDNKNKIVQIIKSRDLYFYKLLMQTRKELIDILTKKDFGVRQYEFVVGKKSNLSIFSAKHLNQFNLDLNEFNKATENLFLDDLFDSSSTH